VNVIIQQSYDELCAQSQRYLIDFLIVEIQLGFTFVEAAAMEHHAGDFEPSRHSKAEAWKAISTVHQFLDRVDSPKVRSAVADRCAELERAVAALPPLKT
jgi:hypothetical protein